MANRLLTQFGGLMWLKDAAHEEMTNLKGIGQAKAVQIAAAVELGRRISNLTTMTATLSAALKMVLIMS